MISEVLRKYIPSKSYVKYLDEIGHEFTDFETAGILHHVIADQELMMKELLKLSEKTEDSRLREQIVAKVEYERNNLEAFRDNAEENAIYMVEYVDEEEPDFYTPIAGFAADYETAYEIGLRTESKFTISKRVIFSRKNGFNKKPEEKGYFNPYIGKEKDWNISEADRYEIIEDCVIDAIGRYEKVVLYTFGELCFNSKGRLERYYVKNSDDEDPLEIMERTFSDKLFYNSFIEFPFPFEQGDFVRLVDNTEDGDKYANGCKCVVGIVDEKRERYENLIEYAKPYYVDAFDAGVTVQFMYEDGKFMHNHVMPVFLEKMEIDKDAEWYDLAMNAKCLIMGEGSLDFFIYEYEKRKAAYRKQPEGR